MSIFGEIQKKRQAQDTRRKALSAELKAMTDASERAMRAATTKQQVQSSEVHPMGALQGWMADFGLLAGSTGLVIALASLLSGGSLAFVLTMPLFMALLGACAGLASGLVLRILRGTVPALVGILGAAFVGNLVPSMLVLMQPEGFNPLADLIRGQAGPLAIALTLLIPLAAVYRSRGQRTWPFMLLAGCLAGGFIALGYG